MAGPSSLINVLESCLMGSNCEELAWSLSMPFTDLQIQKQICKLIGENDDDRENACNDAFNQMYENTHGEINLGFTLICSFQILLMQVGYAFYEFGLVRSKNAKSVLFKVVFTTAFVPIVWWLWGMRVAGDTVRYSAGGFESTLRYDHSVYFLHGASVAVMLGSIISGAVTERMSFEGFAFILLTTISTTFPLALNFVWGKIGFLYKMGFLDYGGGAPVHIVGGASALMASAYVGPRHHRFSKTAAGGLKVHNMPAHSPIFSSIGMILIFVSWMSYLASASVTTKSGLKTCSIERGGMAASNALICVCVAVVLAILRQGYVHKVQSNETMNVTILGALVASTPCGFFIQPWAAGMLGCFSFCVSNLPFFCHFLFVMELDDPCEMVNTHLMQAVLGLIFIGFAADGALVGADTRYDDSYNGILYGGDGKLLGYQILGCVVIFAMASIVTVLTCSIFQALKWFGPIRVPKHDEVLGLDVRYYDGYAYPDLSSHLLKIDKDRKEAEKRMKHMKVASPELVVGSRTQDRESTTSSKWDMFFGSSSTRSSGNLSATTEAEEGKRENSVPAAPSSVSSIVTTEFKEEGGGDGGPRSALHSVDLSQPEISGDLADGSDVSSDVADQPQFVSTRMAAVQKSERVRRGSGLGSFTTSIRREIRRKLSINADDADEKMIAAVAAAAASESLGDVEMRSPMHQRLSEELAAVSAAAMEHGEAGAPGAEGPTPTMVRYPSVVPEGNETEDTEDILNALGEDEYSSGEEM